jgi:twitching motility protein PilT
MDFRDALKHIVENKGSDLHITVGVPPVMRINTVLRPYGDIPLAPKDTEEIALAIMDEEHKKKFDTYGEVDFSYVLPEVARFRVNVYKQRGSIALAFRVIYFKAPTIDELFLPQVLKDLSLKTRGLVLITGPTGSGKSTTLASMVNHINENRNSHIITLEDPIEYLHRHNKSIVNQRDVGTDTHSFEGALRAALREDPDVILVGEMRDLETISTAITAAETGHLVMSTLHTTGAAQSIDRIIDVFPSHQQQQIRIQLAGVIEGIISQQLIPRADGSGMAAALEIMLANNAIRNLIREGKTHQIQNVIETNLKAGMKTLDYSLSELVLKGIVTAEDAIIRSVDHEMLERYISL